MARNATVRSTSGSGNWIGHVDIWHDPRAQLDVTTPTLATPPMATQKQLDYLKSLFESRKNVPEIPFLRAHLLGEYKQGTLTREMARQAIADLLGICPV